MVNFMGMNIGRNLVGNLPRMDEVAKTEQTVIGQKPQTIKSTDVKFPEKKPDVQKQKYADEGKFFEAIGNGSIKKGDYYVTGNIRHVAMPAPNGEWYIIHEEMPPQIDSEL